MSVIVESITIVSSTASPILLGLIAIRNSSKFREVFKKLIDLEGLNKREHKEINESIAYINSRSTLTKALTKVCNSSIAYTDGADDLNSFKTSFTNAIVGLSMATLTSGFKFISKDIFHGYMDVAGNKIIKEYDRLPEDFIPLMRCHIQEASEVYYNCVLSLISDTVFNDKHDRFVDATIAFLRSELMIITKQWWTYNKTESTYTEIK